MVYFEEKHIVIKIYTGISPLTELHSIKNALVDLLSYINPEFLAPESMDMIFKVLHLVKNMDLSEDQAHCISRIVDGHEMPKDFNDLFHKPQEAA